MNLLHVNDAPGRHAPSWYAATAPAPPEHPPLRGAVRSDICVIGAGYTGLSAALHLAARGHDVRVLEAQRVGFGASGRNGGQAAPGQRVDPDTLARRYGAGTAGALWRIGIDAMDHLRALVADHAIDCDWRDGIVEAARARSEVRAAHAHAEYLDAHHGYDRLVPLDRDEVAVETGAAGFAGGVLDRGAAHLHPLKLVYGVARAAEAAGAVVHERSEVTRIVPGAPARVETASGTVTADHVILACNGYLGRLSPAVAARVMPINNFILATEPLGARGSDILANNVAAQDTRFVVNYWRKTPDGRLLFGGGETYGYRFPRDIAGLVRRRMLSVYPGLADVAIDHAWGGTLAITRSRLPVFARPAPGLWSASGYSGHGIALGLYAGEMIGQAIGGTAERFDTMAALPAPAFPGGGRLRAPLLATAMTWFALRDRLGL